MTRPANTVGGDFYDVIPLPDGRLMVALGDVAGKGSPAALLMALLLAMLARWSRRASKPPRLIARLNVQVARHSPASRFITLFSGIYDPATGSPIRERRTYAADLRRGDGNSSVSPDPRAAALALGMFEEARYATTTYDCSR